VKWLNLVGVRLIHPYIFIAQSEAKEINEVKKYYKLAPRKRGISTELL
jgi:hypothetical protein